MILRLGEFRRFTSPRRQLTFDLAIAAVAFLTGAAKLRPWDVRLDFYYLAAVVLTVSAASMLWRRHLPVAVFALALTANVLHLCTDRAGDSSINAGLVVASYGLARYGQGTVRWALPAAGVVPMALAGASSLQEGAGGYAPLVALGLTTATIGVPWLLGANVEARQRAMTALTERAARLEAERELEAVRAVLDERGRIARELHDIVAHHVSVMGVQAGVARLALTADPARAEKSLRSVETTSRHAVDEMRRMLGILRAPPSSVTERSDQPTGDRAPLSPQPGLADLPRVAGQFADAGLRIEMTTDWRLGPIGPVPPEAVQLSAYRIVEQSLTNVLEHAGPVPTRVHVCVNDDAIEVTVTNDRLVEVAVRPEGAPSHSRGHGTVGMRERVRMFDGTLNAGPTPGGGYRVHARLPLEADR
ncbi:sensor histidine kinase [Micromonospora sp. CA-240977]|uniref:sensor histidine kinase n=1 Tax=Micromonospora sp. CA-240977 TaxID=3239957 RepID=UPI003D92DFDF